MLRLIAPAALVLLGPAHAQLVPRDGSAAIGVASSHIEASVEDGLARTKVRQSFVNPHGRTLEAIYRFPIPEGAALVDVAMEVDGQRLEGLLAERRLARRTYDDIVRGNRDPALVEQVGREMFRLSVFPVVPEKETVVELSWIEKVPLTDGAYRYVLPVSADAPPDRLTALVEVRTSAPLADVRASRDDVHVVRRGEREAHASIEARGEDWHRDLVLTCEVATPEPSVVVKTYREEGQEDGWFLAVVTPPIATEEDLIPRDVILVVDTSGSMKEGGKIGQARTAARWLLDHLRPVDRVNVVRFSSDVQAFADEPVEATPGNVAALAAFVDGFRARGSTALGDAIAAAGATPPAEGRVRTVVLLTDGRPTIGLQDPAELVGLAKGVGESGLRLFPFGVGQDVDSGLLEGMATAARGRAEVFRPGGEIASRLISFLARTASPVLADLELRVEGVATHDVHPRPLPDLYLGEELVLAGRFRGAGEARVRLSAVSGGEAEHFETTATFREAPGGSRHVAELFARQKLDWLEDARRLRLGLADDAYYAALDSGAYSTADEIVEEIIDVSLLHGVQSAYTSFLVLLPEDRRRIDPRDAAAIGAALDRVRPGAGETVAAAPGELELEESEGEPDFLSDSPFDSDAFNDVIGIGGGAGGKFGSRRGGRRNLRAAGEGLEAALVSGLVWLESHQGADGGWDADGFADSCGAIGSGTCDGAGGAAQDVTVTSLALLAFLGEGSTPTAGAHRDTVVRGIKWLRARQDPDTGRVGAGPGLLGHALATLALCEAYYSTKSPLLKRSAAKAVEYALATRDAAGAWRDPARPGGDLALTSWMAAALCAALDSGLAVDAAVLAELATHFDAAIDRDGAEALGEGDTAAAILGRVLLGDHAGLSIDRAEALRKRAEAIGTVPSRSAIATASADPMAWYFATFALYQTGGEPWNRWRVAMTDTLVRAQEQRRDARGSWPPSGPWADQGGRVYSTALIGLCTEATIRYGRLLKGR